MFRNQSEGLLKLTWIYRVLIYAILRKKGSKNYRKTPYFECCTCCKPCNINLQIVRKSCSYHKDLFTIYKYYRVSLQHIKLTKYRVSLWFLQPFSLDIAEKKTVNLCKSLRTFVVNIYLFKSPTDWFVDYVP